MRIRNIYFFLCVILTVGLSSELSAQRPQINRPGAQDFYPIDANGRPFLFDLTHNTEGSPYYYDEYLLAEIVLSDGLVLFNVPVKLNLAEKQIQYLKMDGTEMITDRSIRSILIRDRLADGSLKQVLLNSDIGVINEPGSRIYEVLDSGRVSLVMKLEVRYWEEKKYYDTKIIRHYERKETPYALLPSGEYRKLEKGINFFTDLLKDKKKEVTTFIDKNNYRCKTQNEFREIIAFYNSLFRN